MSVITTWLRGIVHWLLGLTRAVDAGLAGSGGSEGSFMWVDVRPDIPWDTRLNEGSIPERSKWLWLYTEMPFVEDVDIPVCFSV